MDGQFDGRRNPGRYRLRYSDRTDNLALTVQTRAMDTERYTCINNQGYKVSLEMFSTYDVIPDNEAAKHQMIRVLDETGEDYLYLKSRFVPAVIFSDQAREGLFSGGFVDPLTGREFRAEA